MSAQMRPASIAEYRYPDGRWWAARTAAPTVPQG